MAHAQMCGIMFRLAQSNGKLQQGMLRSVAPDASPYLHVFVVPCNMLNNRRPLHPPCARS
jgi:hypothetical protein